MPSQKRIIKSTIFVDTEFDYEFVFPRNAPGAKGSLPKVGKSLQIVKRKARKGFVNALRNRLQAQLEANGPVVGQDEGERVKDPSCVGKSPRLGGSSSKQTKKQAQTTPGGLVPSGRFSSFPYSSPRVPLATYMCLESKAAELQREAPRDKVAVAIPESHSLVEASLPDFAMDVDDPSELECTTSITVSVLPPSTITSSHVQDTVDTLALVPVMPLFEEPMEVDYPPLVAETVYLICPPPQPVAAQATTPPDFTITPTPTPAQVPTPMEDAPLATITNTTPKHPASVPERAANPVGSPSPLEKAMNAHRDARLKEQMAKRREIRGLPTRRGNRTGVPTNGGQHQTVSGQSSSSRGTAAPNEGKNDVQRRNGNAQTRAQVNSSKPVPRTAPAQPSDKSKAAGSGKGCPQPSKGKNQVSWKQKNKQQVQESPLDKIWEEADNCRGLMESERSGGKDVSMDFS